MRKKVKKIVWVYLAAWVVAFFLIAIQLMQRGRSLVESAGIFFKEVVPNTAFLVALHILFVLLLLLFFAFAYFRKVYKNNGHKVMFKRLGLYFLLPIALLILSFQTLVYVNTNEEVVFEWDDAVHNTSEKATNHYQDDGLHRGMSVFGWRGDNEEAIANLVRVNTEWVAVIPFIYQENENSVSLRSERKPGDFARRDSTFISAINDLHAKGIRVHLKPHLWLGEGWRSNLKLKNAQEWETWFSSYRDRMLHYAIMAEETGAELFCVGTELRTSIKQQPEAWAALIQEIREIYSGKLTYAANWHDEYEHISFWAELDYIGIQAYFPLTKNKNPDLATIKKGWQPHIKTLAAFSQQYNKPILFTEVGYKSEASATIKPWEWGNAMQVLFKKKSDQPQLLAYEALFEELWHQDWFAGVYIWEWDTRSAEENAPKNLNFSPRFKPAENVIAKWFGKTMGTSNP